MKKSASTKQKIEEKDLEAYLKGNSEDIKNLFYEFRDFIFSTDKNFTEAFKWSHPCYFIDGRIIHYLAPNARHLTFGFWEGGLMEDPDGLLEGVGKKMRHVKITEMADARNKKLLRLMKEAKKQGK